MFIGEIIKKYRMENHISQRAFAARTSLSPSYINTLEKIYNPKTGKPYSITTDVAREISNALLISMEQLLSMLNDKQESKLNTEISKSTSSFFEIPLLDAIKIKNGNEYLNKKNWIGTVTISYELAQTGDFFAFKVYDDSMSPVIVEQDIVIVKKQSNFETGDIVAFRINGKDVMIRKIKQSINGILFQPFNSNCEPFIFNYNELNSLPVIVLGVVKQLKREF